MTDSKQPKRQTLDQRLSADFKKKLNNAKASDRHIVAKAESIEHHSAFAHYSRPNFDGTTERYVTQNNDEIKDRIASCREAYENSGIIGNIIDLMADFALEGFDLEHESPAIKNFFLHWAQKVDLYTLAGNILKNIYRDSNVPILSYRGRIKDEEVNRFQKAVAGEDKANANLFIQDTKPQASRIIPYRYSVLDVLRVWREGSELLGNVYYEYQLSANDTKILNYNGREENIHFIEKLKTSLGDDVVDRMKETGRIPLPTERFTMLYYKKDPYKTWANPMLWRVIDDLKFKKLLRDMDISVAESVISALTIIKLGNTTEGFVAPAAKYNKLASLLKTPTRSKTIIWDDLIEMETAYPPVKEILGAEKYEQVNDDIRSGLGIAEVLINGTGGNFANSFLSVRTLLERLETGRREVVRFVEEEIRKVTKQMGIRKAPTIKFGNMSLMDEETHKQLMLELYDRNLLSAQSLINKFGENFDLESIRMAREDKMREELHGQPPLRLLKVGKYGPQLQGEGLLEEEADQPEPSEDPMQQGDEGDEGGRPNGPGRRQQGNPGTRRQRPQGQASQQVVAEEDDELDEVYKKYNDTVNMSASELEKWSENPCSKEASKDRSPIKRNLRLLRKKKSEWTSKDIKDANRTISFVSRMRGAEQGEPVKIEVDGKEKTCPSKRDISLKNWAFDPSK